MTDKNLEFVFDVWMLNKLRVVNTELLRMKMAGERNHFFPIWREEEHRLDA